MRKNTQNGKVLKKLYYTSFEIKGLNLDSLINLFKKRGITLYNIKKYGNKRLIITAKAQDNEKIFAISKELCYNIRKLRDGGRLYPLLYLYRNIGILVGALIFTVGVILANDLVFSVNFSGSGSEYYREVTDLLTQKGIVRFSHFSDFDLKKLSSEILASNKRLSFVTCEKRGNRLNVELALAGENIKTLSGNQTALVSDQDGVIESVKVYRGTPLVAVGDAVKKGDILVGGYATVQDKTVETGVIAFVTLRVESVCRYVSYEDGVEDQAVAFALAKAQDKAVLDWSVEKVADGENIIYNVRLVCRRVLYAD